MKSLFFVLLFGLCVPVLAASGPDGKVTNKSLAAPRAPATSGGYWCRAANGRLVWVKPAPENAIATVENPQQKPANGARTRVYSYYRPQPNVVTSYPDSFRPEVVNGIDWYLNGRSYFSD